MQWVRDLEAVWQARDGARAREGYTDDAVLVWGANQRQSGAALLARPAQWFAHAMDLRIHKTHVAHTDDCIVATWDSTYTDPLTGKRMHERGIECFYFRAGKVREQRAWQHSWADDDSVVAASFSTD